MLVKPGKPPPVRSLHRRELIRRGAGLALGAAVAPRWRRAPAAAADPRVEELGRLLRGDVIGRGQPWYGRARLLFDTAYDAASPLAIAYCTSADDVARTIAWARRHRIRLAARSGGHSYGGYSTTPGVILDLSRLSRVTVAGTTAVVGAGARLIDVQAELAAHAVAVPTGSCPSVGISGLTLGGGNGPLSRKWGLAADNVLELELVTAAGRQLVCNAREHSDLYWACRGGGGGNFGVVTRWTFRAHPVRETTVFRVDWPFEQLPAVLAAWQQLVQQAPDGFYSVLALSSSGGAGSVTAVGQLLGKDAELAALLGPLLGAGTPTRAGRREGSHLEAVLEWAGCRELQRCRVGPGGEVRRVAFAAKSDFVREPLPAEAATVIAAALNAAPGRAELSLDAYGGAVNRVPKEATAFVHRDALCTLEYVAYGAGGSVSPAARRWLRDFHAALRPFGSGEAYQNYVDPELPNWQQAYYGANLRRLVAVKRRYDPADVFRFAQSIPTRL